MDSDGAPIQAKWSIKETAMTWRQNRRAAVIVLLCAFLLAGSAIRLLAQQSPQRGQPPRTPRESAQVDLTGYWVPLITEDWLYRVVTPPKGDTTSVPLNAEGVRVAKDWDLAKDLANGELCKAYGAPGIMRLP